VVSLGQPRVLSLTLEQRDSCNEQRGEILTWRGVTKGATRRRR
jgi:hypothetical protein